MSATHHHDLAPWQHAHDFVVDRRATERRAWWVVAITVAMMAVEIGAGWWWHSMALLADGWHMGTHAVAIGVTGLSYGLARRWARDARFSLGPWKIEVLGAYTSALLLAVVAVSITAESVLRLLHAETVAYDESLVVAVIGLVVNLVCARLLHHAPGGHGHGHDDHGHGTHGHEHGHGQAAETVPAAAHRHDRPATVHHAHPQASGHRHAHGDGDGDGHAGDHDHPPHAAAVAPAMAGAARATPAADHDLNRQAAYLHVLADAATSLLAIGALLAGKWLGWSALDALVGLLGAGLIAWWARGLLAQSATILLDREMDHPLAGEVRQRLESDGDAKVADLHLWRVGGDAFACAATLVADAPHSADAYRERLHGVPRLAHVMIEVNRCPAAAPAR